MMWPDVASAGSVALDARSATATNVGSYLTYPLHPPSRSKLDSWLLFGAPYA